MKREGISFSCLLLHAFCAENPKLSQVQIGEMIGTPQPQISLIMAGEKTILTQKSQDFLLDYFAIDETQAKEVINSCLHYLLDYDGYNPRVKDFLVGQRVAWAIEGIKEVKNVNEVKNG